MVWISEKGCDFMATSTFTKHIVLSNEAADILAEDLSADREIKRPIVSNYKLNDKEFIEKCIRLSDCKK